MNEDILKKALEQTLDESYNELIDQDIPDYDFSPEFKAKMDGLILSQQTQPEKRRSKMLWFAAMAAAAALLCVTIGVNAASRPSRTHDTPTNIISETPSQQNTDVTGSKDTAVTSVSTVSSGTASSAVEASDKTTAKTTETTAVTEKQKTTSVSSSSQKTTASAPSETTSANSNSAAQTSQSVTSKAETTAASSAPVTTSVSVTVTDITTTTGASDDPPTERSFSMKKISAFLAGLIAMNPLTPVISNAEDQNADIPVSPLISSSVYYVFSEDMFDKFREFRSDESVLDFDEDGNFTLKDVYFYKRMVYTSDQIKEKSRFEFNVDGRGEANTIDDLNALIYYYATYNSITKEQLEPEYYLDMLDGIERDMFNNYDNKYTNSEEFADMLARKSNEIFRLYDVFKTITEEKEVNFDVDGNGTFDFGDVIDFSFFNYGNKYVAGVENYEYFTYREYLSEDVYDRCAEVHHAYVKEGKAPLVTALSEYLLQYYIEKNGFDPNLTSSAYLGTFRSYGTGTPLQPYIQSLQYVMGFGNGDMRYQYLYENGRELSIDEQYEKLCSLADEGKITIPDLNSDGQLDVVDIRLADLFFDTYRYTDDIPFPTEYRDNFLNNMDLNQNGFPGDIFDISIYQTYITDLNQYESVNDVLVQYYYDHPDFDPEHAGEYMSLAYGYESAQYDKYLSEIEEGTNKKPDINKDGKVDIADYVIAEIIQSNKAYGYAERLAIVPDDIKEYYLNDCDFDKDGHSATFRDLDLVTMYVAEQLGFDLDKYDFKMTGTADLYNDLYYIAEEYVSQFDDILPEDGKTIKAHFVPELIEGLTLDQLRSIEYYGDEVTEVEENRRKIKNNITEEQKKMLDTNLNGKVDLEDFMVAKALNSNYMIENYLSPEESKFITQDRKDNFYSNYDFNGNGVSGDNADMKWAEYLYEQILDVDNVESAYNDAIYAAENEKRLAWMNMEAEEKEKIRQQYVDQYRKDVESGKMPAPDINEDGKVDIVDYVAVDAATHSEIIFQYRYELITEAHIITDEQLKRYFDTYDLDKNGRGGDEEDHFLLQKYIQQELGYDNEELSVREEEYVSQFDDILREYQKSLFYGLKEELVKDMTSRQKMYLSVAEEDSDYYLDYAKQNEFNADMVKQFDVNMNGTLEVEDYLIAKYLQESYHEGVVAYQNETSLITDEISSSFYKNFDPDKNGICGSYGDILIMKYYFQRIYDNDYFEYEYREGTLNQKPFPLESLVDMSGTEDKRNGDANVDATVNLADSVAILQAYINPDKYALTDEGRYNADISNTGDGVTPQDAQQIQKILLNIK